jgi:dephospho-CoA kinase
MALFYVTGTPGTGKSTIQKALTRMGYEAHDLDESRFGGPYNKATDRLAIMPPVDERTPQWFDAHEWRVSRSAVEALKENSKDKTVFICGTATTENLIWDLFDKIFYLNINEATLRSRIANRQDNDFGKTEHELERILERYHEAQKKLKDLNVIEIDANGSVDSVTSAIYETIN